MEILFFKGIYQIRKSLLLKNLAFYGEVLALELEVWRQNR